MLPREFINYQDKLYWVYRKVKHHQVKEGSVNDLKEFWLCDIVIKSRNQNDDTLLFMREIEEAKIVS
jgi:predicted nucleotide-binding protein (sugar kinase/HSP70/actin superfamily)